MQRPSPCVVADDIARQTGRPAQPVGLAGLGLAQKGRAIGRLDHVGHVAGGGNVGDRHRYGVVEDIEDLAHKNSRIQRHRLARFQIDLEAMARADVADEVDQRRAVIIAARDVVPATKVDSFQLRHVGGEHGLHRLPCAAQRREPLFAQSVYVHALDTLHRGRGQVRDRHAEP